MFCCIVCFYQFNINTKDLSVILMDIGQLEAFERAAREGSFTAAAESLGLTQPAISTRISNLEKELGGLLFTRGNKRLILTALGASILPYAEKVLHATADAQQMAAQYQQGKMGSVSIAALDTLGVAMLPEPMTLFREQFPSVDFTIRLRIRQQIVNMLYDGRVTLGLTAAPLWDKGLSVLARFRNPIRAVVSANHPLASRANLSVNMLQNYPLYRCTLSPNATAIIQEIATQAQLNTGNGLTSIPAIMAVQLLLQSKGVAFLPQALIQPYLDLKQLVVLPVSDLPQLYTEPLLITLADRALDAPNAAFVKLLCERWEHMRTDTR